MAQGLAQGADQTFEPMFAIIGILAVFGAVIGGFLMEKGKLLVLVQPSELVIIGGAAIGKRYLSVRAQERDGQARRRRGESGEERDLFKVSEAA
jgi:hypothetical protein